MSCTHKQSNALQDGPIPVVLGVDTSPLSVSDASHNMRMSSGCRSFTYEEFISAQEKFQKSQAGALAVRNGEVARAIEDVITLVQV